MSLIHKSGFYISESFHWVDWHAGVKFEGDNFYIIKFEERRCYFDTVEKIEDVNLPMITKKENFGIYRIVNDLLEISYNPNSEFEVKREFLIQSSELLIDENGKEYRYIK